MEPVSTTIIYSTLTWFIGYFVGSDFFNYYKDRSDFNEVKDKLDDINREIRIIHTKLH